MSLFDTEALLAPVTAEQPCGPDLRAEPEFRDLEDAPGGFPSLKAPDLLKVVKQCAEVLTRTKDQMPAIVAAQAAARAGSLSTVNAALDFIARLAEAHWEDFHPGPAEEMAIGRINELSALARPAALLLPLQRLALAALPSPSEVEFTAAMVERALESVPEWTAADDEKLKKAQESGAVNAAAARQAKPTHEGARQLRGIMATVAPEVAAVDSAANAAAKGVDAEQARPLALQLRAQVADRRADMQVMSDHLYAIAEIYERRASDSPSFGPLLAQLKSMLGSADRFLALFPDPSATAAAEPPAAEQTMGAVESAGATSDAAPARPRGFSGDVPRNRADVLVAFDAIAKYYAEQEPTSPVPLMLKRVREWVEMDFLRLLKEIAPGGVDEAGRLLAIRND